MCVADRGNKNSDRQLLLQIIRDLEARLIAADKQEGEKHKLLYADLQKARQQLDDAVQQRLRAEHRYVAGHLLRLIVCTL